MAAKTVRSESTELSGRPRRKATIRCQQAWMILVTSRDTFTAPRDSKQALRPGAKANPQGPAAPRQYGTVQYRTSAPVGLSLFRARRAAQRVHSSHLAGARIRARGRAACFRRLRASSPPSIFGSTLLPSVQRPARPRLQRSHEWPGSQTARM